ncbi:MAG: 30S ribosomal protein THX [Longimicrobiales bacterium]
MGRGDHRSRKGKIFRGSYGKARPRKEASKKKRRKRGRSERPRR